MNPGAVGVGAAARQWIESGGEDALRCIRDEVAQTKSKSGFYRVKAEVADEVVTQCCYDGSHVRRLVGCILVNDRVPNLGDRCRFLVQTSASRFRMVECDRGIHGTQLCGRNNWSNGPVDCCRQYFVIDPAAARHSEVGRDGNVQQVGDSVVKDTTTA